MTESLIAMATAHSLCLSCQQTLQRETHTNGYKLHLVAQKGLAGAPKKRYRVSPRSGSGTAPQSGPATWGLEPRHPVAVGRNCLSFRPGHTCIERNFSQDFSSFTCHT